MTKQKTYRHRVQKASKRGIRIKDQVSIEERPAHVELIEEAGHWEGDLIIGPNQKSCMGTLVERKLRYTLLVKLPNKKADVVQSAFAKRLNELPQYLRQTMTYDNGVEMAKHQDLAKQTCMDIYFAHPYHSWERGTNENMNGVIRRFFSKKTDFNTVSQEQMDDLERHLNNRPRKVLGYKTPNEKLLEEKNNIIMMMMEGWKREINL